MNQDAIVESLLDRIRALFGHRDVWLVVAEEGGVAGCDGLLALHLVANSLFAHFYWDSLGLRPNRPDAVTATDPRLTQVKLALHRLAAESPAWFVVCYHLWDSSEWNMAWSESLPPCEAYREMAGFVRAGMDLWVNP